MRRKVIKTGMSEREAAADKSGEKGAALHRWRLAGDAEKKVKQLAGTQREQHLKVFYAYEPRPYRSSELALPNPLMTAFGRVVAS